MPSRVLVLVCLPVLLGVMFQTAESVWERSRPYTPVDLKALGNFPFDGVAGRITDVPSQ